MIEVFFQIPNPFITPTPDPATLAGGGGGIGNGTLIGLAIVAIGALAPSIKSWLDGRSQMTTQTTQATLSTHTAMLTSAITRADRLEAQLQAVQKEFSDLRERFARMEAQLADKTHELEIAARERDLYKTQIEEKEVIIQRQRTLIDEQRLTIQKLELLNATNTTSVQSGKTNTEIK